MADKPKLPNRKLPDGITAERLQANFSEASTYYTVAHKRLAILDAADRGRIWEAIRAQFPGYQILPDTNFVNYVKEYLVAGIYTVGKSARVIPTSSNDIELTGNLNILLDHYWDTFSVATYQRKAGERAALLNLGVTMVSWDEDLPGADLGLQDKGGPKLKNINPARYMRDPFAESLDSAGYCMTWDFFRLDVLMQNSNYRPALEALRAAGELSGGATSGIPVNLMTDKPIDAVTASQKDQKKLVIHWVRNGDDICEIHTIDNKDILLVKEKISPAMFPFAELYCNEPSGDLVGTSGPAKIFSNALAYNLINSVLLTAEYKNQRPPKFISNTSGINVAAFTKHSNDADRTFVVNGDATKAVHYHQFPFPSNNAAVIARNLFTDIQTVSGVDGRYTGRDTGSILTTGGVEAMLDQVTLIDAAKVQNYEDYTKRLTKLILCNLMEMAPKRTYFIKNPKTNKYAELVVDFAEMRKESKKMIFGYALSISSELPKNKARLAQVANMLMEKQMQYGQAGAGQVEFITPEEWLMFQDIPFQELIQERMGIQRTAEYQEKVAEIVFAFGNMVGKGVAPEQAMQAIAADMAARENPAAMVGQPELPMENSSANPLTNQNMPM
jgi:hypothetical protein